MLKQNYKEFRPEKITVYVFVVVISVVLGFIILALISNSADNEYKEEAIQGCIALCKNEIAKGTILNSGPCLSNNIAPGWACDIVSNPKNKLIDDLPDNQCAAYKNKIVRNIVEITPNCVLIKAH